MIFTSAFSGVHAGAAAKPSMQWSFHPAAPVVASAHRAGWALTAINPQYKRRTAAATSTSVSWGTT
ncbi:hypothetical protein ACXPWS_22905 [Mycobacterium sp. BMJ-28]